MISEIKRTYDPGAIYLVNKDITRFHRSDNPINGKTLHTGTPVVYIQTIQQTDSCIVRDYTGQLWRLSRDDLDHQPASEIPAKGEILLYKLPFFLAPFSFLGGVVLFFFRLFGRCLCMLWSKLCFSLYDQKCIRNCNVPFIYQS